LGVSCAEPASSYRIFAKVKKRDAGRCLPTAASLFFMPGASYMIDFFYRIWTRKQAKVPREATLDNGDPEPRIDVNSPTWRFIKRRTEERIACLREYNDKTHLDSAQTAVIRGGIKELKELLDAPNR
jgi:hypothetical protein